MWIIAAFLFGVFVGITLMLVCTDYIIQDEPHDFGGKGGNNNGDV